LPVTPRNDAVFTRIRNCSYTFVHTTTLTDPVVFEGEKHHTRRRARTLAADDEARVVRAAPVGQRDLARIGLAGAHGLSQRFERVALCRRFIVL
jgi:hypothetical protein